MGNFKAYIKALLEYSPISLYRTLFGSPPWEFKEQNGKLYFRGREGNWEQINKHLKREHPISRKACKGRES